MKLLISIGVLIVRLLSDSPPPNQDALSAQKADQSMKVCMIGTTAEQDNTAEVVSGYLLTTDRMTIKTLLPEKAGEVRSDKAKAKSLGYTHVLLVRVTHSANIMSLDPNTKLHNSTLNLQLYDVSSDAVCQTWVRRGVIATSARTDDDNPNAKSRALQDVAENAADIFETPKPKEKKK